MRHLRLEIPEQLSILCECSFNFVAKLNDPARYTTNGAAAMALAGELRDGVDVLIVDPPRKGLDEEVLQELERSVS